MDATDLCYAPATQLLSLIRRKELSPVDLCRALLERIERVNQTLNAFCAITAEAALDAARRAERAAARGESLGPLHGLPVTIKDLAFTRGVRTMAGSFIYERRVTDVDAGVRLEGARRQPTHRHHAQPVESRHDVGRLERGRCRGGGGRARTLAS